jgi:hypothetical protein
VWQGCGGWMCGSLSRMTGTTVGFGHDGQREVAANRPTSRARLPLQAPSNLKSLI